MTELWKLENEIYAEGFELICGVDEAGRGPLAGPVCAAAVILPRGIEIAGLDDSKKLTDKKREALYDVICENALTYGIAFASVEEIESINILNAAMLAMNRAIEKLAPQPATDICSKWRKSTRSTILKSTRATAQSCTTRHCVSMDRARYIARAF